MAAARLFEAERLFLDFVELTPYKFKPFVKSFNSFDEYERGDVSRRTPGTDNRVLRICRLLNGRRVPINSP